MMTLRNVSCEPTVPPRDSPIRQAVPILRRRRSIVPSRVIQRQHEVDHLAEHLLCRFAYTNRLRKYHSRDGPSIKVSDGNSGGREQIDCSECAFFSVSGTTVAQKL